MAYCFTCKNSIEHCPCEYPDARSEDNEQLVFTESLGEKHRRIKRNTKPISVPKGRRPARYENR